jgi:putative transposase
MAGEVIDRRQKVLDQAYARNPERFTHARPKHPPQPTAVWINSPIQASATERNLH